MDKIKLKSELLDQCLEIIETRIDVAQKAVDDAQSSANEEGKSSMGDKYETSRARMQMQRDQHAQQLSAALKVRMVLDMLDPEKEFDEVGFGAVVQTKLANYYISISAGRILVGEEKFFAISKEAPLALEMIGKKIGDEVTFNDQSFKILDIY